MHDRYAARAVREQWSRRKNEVVTRLKVSQVVGRVLPLTRAGHELETLCPFHEERTPSFKINDAKQFYHCFGCGAHGNVVDFVMKRQCLSFQSAIELLEAESGLRSLQLAKPVPTRPRIPQRDELEKAFAVERIWRETAEVAAGSVVDRYLRGRGLVPPAEFGIGNSALNAGWPSDIRFAPELWHGLEKKRLPGMVTAMRRAGKLVAVHRTYLRVSGVGVKKAGTQRDKAMFGNVAGAFIRLGPDDGKMVGGEGIETSLAAMQIFRRSGIALTVERYRRRGRARSRIR